MTWRDTNSERALFIVDLSRYAVATTSKQEAGLSPSAEGVRNWLEQLGVADVYTPIDQRSLHFVVNPNTGSSVADDNLEVSEKSADELPGSVEFRDYHRLFMPEVQLQAQIDR